MSKFLITFCLLIIFLMPIFAFAADYGLEETAKEAQLSTETSIEALIGRVIKAVLSLVGIIMFVLIIYGGFLWMTAAGDEKKVSKGKSILTDAIIGLIVVLAAYTITHFVISSLTK